jgi:alpha-aminoadipate carrier protein LysW
VRRGNVAKCPECDAEVTVGSDAVKGEIVSCPDCGAELEVKETAPVALALAPKAEEDWGE